MLDDIVAMWILAVAPGPLMSHPEGVGIICKVSLVSVMLSTTLLPSMAMASADQQRISMIIVRFQKNKYGWNLKTNNLYFKTIFPISARLIEVTTKTYSTLTRSTQVNN